MKTKLVRRGYWNVFKVAFSSLPSTSLSGSKKPIIYWAIILISLIPPFPCQGRRWQQQQKFLPKNDYSLKSISFFSPPTPLWPPLVGQVLTCLRSPFYRVLVRKLSSSGRRGNPLRWTGPHWPPPPRRVGEPAGMGGGRRVASRWRLKDLGAQAGSAAETGVWGRRKPAV